MLILQLINELIDKTNKNICVNNLVTDDDSTLRKWRSTKSNGGHSNDNIPQPTFLADPGHRYKVMVRSIFSLVSVTRKQDEVKNIDAFCLKKYTACYINQHRNGDFKTFLANARAPVEHLFKQS